MKKKILFPGYQAAFSQLAFAGKKDNDPCAAVPDAKIHLAKSLHQLSASHPGKVSSFCCPLHMQNL